jgi:hypothetical protein
MSMGYTRKVDESRDFRKLLRRVVVRAALAGIAVGLAAWVTSGFERPWAELAGIGGFVAIVIVAGETLWPSAERPRR